MRRRLSLRGPSVDHQLIRISLYVALLSSLVANAHYAAKSADTLSKLTHRVRHSKQRPPRHEIHRNRKAKNKKLFVSAMPVDFK
jgi:hypothetical protein